MVKKTLAAALLLGVAGVWVPQLMSASSDTKLTTPREVAADGTGLDLGSLSVLETVEHESAPLPGEDSSDVDGSKRRVARPIELESAVARAQSLVAQRSPFDVPVPTTNDAPDSHGPVQGPAFELAASPVDLAPQATASTTGLDTPRLVDTDPFAAFLATHPLQGTVIGGGDRVATLGPRLVRVGDEVETGVIVVAIESRHVELRGHGRAVRVELQPFRARAPVANGNSNSAGGANSAAAGAGGGGANDAPAGAGGGAGTTTGAGSVGSPAGGSGAAESGGAAGGATNQAAGATATAGQEKQGS